MLYLGASCLEEWDWAAKLEGGQGSADEHWFWEIVQR